MNSVRSLIAMLSLTGLLGAAPAAQAQDVKAGEKKAAMCFGCHAIADYKASFPAVYRVPMIAGQNAKYLVSALQQYRKGDRKHPTMGAVAISLTNADINDLAAYFSGQAGTVTVPAVLASGAPPDAAELLKRGGCQNCHGPNLSTPIDPSYPKLAGQHADYLFEALRAYQTDSNPRVGRSNPIMTAMARQFSHAEVHVLADYIGSLPSQLKTVQQSRFR